MKLRDAQRYLVEVGAREARKTLRAKRESVGLSQNALARISKVAQSNINKVENGKQVITPRAWSRMMTAIEKLSNTKTEKSALEKRIAEAQARVALCRLPWMRQELPQAEAALAELKAAAKGEDDVFGNPHVIAVLESLQRETVMYKEVAEGFASVVGMRIADAVINHDPVFVKAYEHWKTTGEVTLKPAIDGIEKVEQGDK